MSGLAGEHCITVGAISIWIAFTNFKNVFQNRKYPLWPLHFADHVHLFLFCTCWQCLKGPGGGKHFRVYAVFGVVAQIVHYFRLFVVKVTHSWKKRNHANKDPSSSGNLLSELSLAVRSDAFIVSLTFCEPKFVVLVAPKPHSSATPLR